MKKLFAVLFLIMPCVLWTFAQETFPMNGVYDYREGIYAFTNATIHTAPGKSTENATLLVKDGKIEGVGKGISIPKNAVTIDLKGKHIYPSFIDLYSDYGMPEPKEGGNDWKPQPLSKKDGAYMWNEALKPEFRAHQAFKANPKQAGSYRAAGFGAVLSHRHDGMSRGSSVLVSLADDREHELILKEKVAHHLSFSKGTSTQSYPSSLMGGIALLRQTYYDADWYGKEGKKKETNISLDAWNELNGLPQFFSTRDRLELLRAAKIGKEFGKTYVFRGAGDEYQRLSEIKGTGSAIIIPINFPEAYDASDPYDAMQISLSDMKHWELAPTNPGKIANAGVTMAITSSGLKKRGDFMGLLHKAIKNGLSEEQALASLTTIPAKLAGASSMLGTLERGKLAHFIVTDKPVFEKGATIHHNWVGGNGYVLNPFKEYPNLGRGVFNFSVGKKTHELQVDYKEEVPSYVIKVNDSTDVNVKYTYANNILGLSYTMDDQMYRLTGSIDPTGTSAKGYGQTPDGDWVKWSASPTRALPDSKDEEEKKEDGKKDEEKEELGKITYPFLPYGWEEKPKAETVLIKGATVWTNEKEGILEDTDVLLQNGKIAQIGKNLSARADKTIDGKGKHVTCGIIDEHSHIAISRGVNEGTQYSSAEVSIADVVNSEDVNIYRNLAGGVVAAQLLHGSANPIGGQSGIVKFRWGFTPEEMKIKNSAPFIKFALGENVKQSNWGDDYRSRFPQTRMGVEEVYDDHFTRAAEYGKLKKSGKPYRKDIEMEVILEILEKKRFITCHSYQQGEINMLMKVADRHGFTLNTFTHILEGYKVADKMKEHGAGGSTFADWWAYKYEVIDAVPHNAAILTKAGVVTAINSDDAEMSRRLNQEAAKAVMYGGLSEEEAWKLVTLNPAKLLHLDDHMGSIKVGKDADIVVWSDNPLSIYAKAEQTFVDGIRFFDKARDTRMRQEIKAERARLINKMIGVKNGGGKTQPPSIKYNHHYHCDHIDDEMGEQHQHHDHHDHHEGHNH